MKYLRSRKRRFCYLAMLIVIALAWPFLSSTNLNMKEFFLYVAGLIAPAFLLFYIRKHIVRLLQRFGNIFFCKCVRGISISIAAVWVFVRIGLAIDSIIHGKNIGQLILLYLSLFPAIGAYGFSIKKRITPRIGDRCAAPFEMECLVGSDSFSLHMCSSTPKQVSTGFGGIIGFRRSI